MYISSNQKMGWSAGHKALGEQFHMHIFQAGNEVPGVSRHLKPESEITSDEFQIRFVFCVSI